LPIIGASLVTNIAPGIADYSSAAYLIVKILVGVSVSPQADFWTIQDKLIKITAVSTVHGILILILEVCAEPAGCVVSHYDHTV
jgi:hypothetical protein